MMKAKALKNVRYAILAAAIIVALAGIAIFARNSETASLVAINVTEQNSSWKITNAGNTDVQVEVDNGITAMVIRKLGIGKSREVPKENATITARQEFENSTMME